MQLRSVVMVGAGGDLEAALASQADAVLLTLNDASVAVGALRAAAVEATPRIRAAGKRALVVVNHPRTRLLRDDVEAIVMPDLAGVLLPHACEPQDARDLAVALREFEQNRGIEPGTIVTFPMIDTARGLLRAAEIVHATPRAGGLVFDSAGYSRDVGARHEELGPRLAYARGAVVAAARAYDTLPLVLASGTEIQFLAQHGFAGVVLPDAGFVAQANAAFTPATAARERAERQAAAYDAARAEGAWVARDGTDLVDSHAGRKARQALE